MQILDITIPLDEKTPLWEGDKGVSLKRVSWLSRGADFNVTRMEMGVHSGTHIDAPFHLFDHAVSVDAIPLEILVGDAQVVNIPASVGEISPDDLRKSGLESGVKRLLLKTRNSNFWKDDPYSFRRDFVAINARTASFLVDEGIELIGIDYFSISPMADLKTPHEILLEAGVVILENVNLLGINAGFYQLVCLPMKLVGTDGAPVRAILIRN